MDRLATLFFERLFNLYYDIVSIDMPLKYFQLSPINLCIVIQYQSVRMRRLSSLSERHRQLYWVRYLDIR